MDKLKYSKCPLKKRPILLEEALEKHMDTVDHLDQGMYYQK